MRTAVITDIHGNLEALLAVIDHARERGADAFVCLGDVVGYNADPGACVDVLRGLPGVRCLLGNHDAMALGEGPLPGINEHARAAMVWTREQLDAEQKSWLADRPLTCEDGDAQYCHASLADPPAWLYVHSEREAIRHFERQRARVAFVGHSHVPFAWRDDGGNLVRIPDVRIELGREHRWLVSVSSVGQPRDGDPRTGYVLYDPDAGTVAQERLEYDVEAARRKILSAGLPEGLADRLGRG